ncbi:hypothetical protein HID58_078440, partial [Brassica napus]
MNISFLFIFALKTTELQLRKQKEVFRHHCFKFLSTYIWMSPKQVDKNIIILQLLQGQLDEALRPIVYARIDSCSPKDFQYLHTVF